MEDVSSVSVKVLVWTSCWIDDSFIRLSAFTVKGLPLNTGLKRSIIDISNSHRHGAIMKLKKTSSMINLSEYFPRRDKIPPNGRYCLEQKRACSP